MIGTEAAENTDVELWREVEGDYYAPSVHVTKGGGIGINVGGKVYVKPLREWHKLADPHPDTAAGSDEEAADAFIKRLPLTMAGFHPEEWEIVNGANRLAFLTGISHGRAAERERCLRVVGIGFTKLAPKGREERIIAMILTPDAEKVMAGK